MAKYIILVHGLGGSASETWGDFPRFLSTDAAIDYEIISLGYTSPHPLKQFIYPAPTILSLANGLLTDLKQKCDLENDDVILVGHSLGGIIIRRLLLRLKSTRQKHKIKKICFFDVPHEGSGFANVGTHIARSNRHLKQLCKNVPDLDDLHEQWIDNELDKIYEILSVIDANETVVSSISSKSIFRSHRIETINNVDHISIVKPGSKEDTVVKVLKDFITAARTITKYSNRASVPYESWLRHDRKHTCQFITDQERAEAVKALTDALDGSKRLVRITGLSGLGKSRLLFEYISGSRNLPESDILIFDASSDSSIADIKDCIIEALQDDVTGLVIIENCPIALHNYISREMDEANTQLRIATVGFNHESVESSAHIRLGILAVEAIEELVTHILPDFENQDIQRISAFVEGYPLLAILIAERYRDDGVLVGVVSDEAFVEKLINVDGPLPNEKLNVLKVCSLFDTFGINGSQQDQANFIYDLADATRTDFEQLVTTFCERQIISKIGNYARVVPKPLAVFLAAKWWHESLDGSKHKLINDMPDTMLQSFCDQITYLDNSEKVKDFVEEVCSRFSPFGQAELLLTIKGSRLFRALVEVNPKATCDALYRVFEQIDNQGISEIKGDVRRNLVWALEMLCFHKTIFQKAAWCLFKLACYENESYSNNATGQWAQLFRWQLSGTEANLEQRTSIIDKALDLNKEESDLVVVKAIKSAISTFGGTRTLGAEFQGTKAELKEWRPKVWGEVFEYWEQLMDILISLAEKPYAIEAVKDTIGHEIRGLIGVRTIGMLDRAIRSVVESNGKYWPSATQSIIHALDYDKEGMSDEVRQALLGWQKLLSPDEDNLREQLLLIVLDPSREHEIDENGDYIDVAAIEAIAFAKRILEVEDLNQHVDFILGFKEQKQTWVFGKTLALNLIPKESQSLYHALISSLARGTEKRFDLVSGYLSGVNEKNQDVWLDILDRFSSEPELIYYFPQALRTGECTAEQREVFIDLVNSGAISSNTAYVFSYGGVTDHLTEEEITDFCKRLSLINVHAAWNSLDILNSYMFGKEDYDFEKIKPTLEILALRVSFNKGDKLQTLSAHHWQRSVEKLLKSGDEKFAQTLVDYILEQVVNFEIDYSDLWDSFHKTINIAFQKFADQLWPNFSQKILSLSEKSTNYRLKQLLSSGRRSGHKTRSLFTLVDEDAIVEWCRHEPALLLVSSSLELFDSSKKEKVPNSLIVRLLKNYGNNPKLRNEIRANFHSRSWSGSIVPYLEADKLALECLKDHESPNVRQWVAEFIAMIENDIEWNKKNETEEKFVRGW